MICREIGNYRFYEVEKDDLVVVIGQVGSHRDFLTEMGFEEDPETRDWIGSGACLYRMTPEAFSARFGVEGRMALQAQVTDRERFCVVDALPQVGEDWQGRPVIAKIHALELDIREVIDQVMSRMLERG